MDTLQKINELIAENRIDCAANLLDQLSPEARQSAEALFLRGKIAWRRGERAEAMSLYNQASLLENNPQGPATIALEQAREVFAFYNTDLYNP